MASDNFRSDPERAAQLAVYLAIHSQKCGVTPAPGLIARTVVAMQKAARSAKRAAEYAAEYACNGPATPGGMSIEWYRTRQKEFELQQARAEKRLARDTERLNFDLCALMGYPQLDEPPTTPPTVTLGGDPRGSCGTLHIPGQPGDGWGDGFAIY